MRAFSAIKTLAAAAILAASAGVTGVSAATVGTDLTGFIAGDANVRYRATNGGDELYVGINDLGVAGNRSQASFAYAASAAFSVSYDSLSGSIQSTYNGITRSFAAAAGSMFDALRVDIRGPGGNGNHFSLTGLTVNGEAVSDLGSATPPASNTTMSWLISAFADAPTLTFAGTLNYFGPSTNTSAEATRISILLGEGPDAAPVPLPAAGWLLIAGIGGLVAAGRRRKATAA